MTDEQAARPPDRPAVGEASLPAELVGVDLTMQERLDGALLVGDFWAGKFWDERQAVMRLEAERDEAVAALAVAEALAQAAEGVIRALSLDEPWLYQGRVLVEAVAAYRAALAGRDRAGGGAGA